MKKKKKKKERREAAKQSPVQNGKGLRRKIKIDKVVWLRLGRGGGLEWARGRRRDKYHEYGM